MRYQESFDRQFRPNSDGAVRCLFLILPNLLLKDFQQEHEVLRRHVPAALPHCMGSSSDHLGFIPDLSQDLASEDLGCITYVFVM